MSDGGLGPDAVGVAARTLLGRPTRPGEAERILEHLGPSATHRELTAFFLATAEHVADVLAHAPDVHLHAIHAARVRLVATVLPAARTILDLGGANAPLCDMGYPHVFDRLVVVDLPPGDDDEPTGRPADERDTAVGAESGRGRARTDLGTIPDGSVDLVWAGQAIELVTEAAAERVYAEVRRVPAPDGRFCLDTPNRLLTAIHTGGGFIRPDHRVEYTPAQLVAGLRRGGFEVVTSLGVCDMPRAATTGRFDYRELLTGAGVTASVDTAYLQYHECRLAG